MKVNACALADEIYTVYSGICKVTAGATAVTFNQGRQAIPYGMFF